MIRVASVGMIFNNGLLQCISPATYVANFKFPISKLWKELKDNTKNSVKIYCNFFAKFLNLFNIILNSNLIDLCHGWFKLIVYFPDVSIRNHSE